MYNVIGGLLQIGRSLIGRSGAEGEVADDGSNSMGRFQSFELIQGRDR